VLIGQGSVADRDIAGFGVHFQIPDEHVGVGSAKFYGRYRPSGFCDSRGDHYHRVERGKLDCQRGFGVTCSHPDIRRREFRTQAGVKGHCGDFEIDAKLKLEFNRICKDELRRFFEVGPRFATSWPCRRC
jgi:hypothetical protein